jgi:hypothetical protein
MISQEISERDRYSAKMIEITLGAYPACRGTLPCLSLMGQILELFHCQL